MKILPNETPIYQYVSTDKLISILESQKIRFSKISNWKDKYEGKLFNKINILVDPKNALTLSNIFASSWTLENLNLENTDQAIIEDLSTYGAASMWDVYCSNGGARLKTTIGKLKGLPPSDAGCKYISSKIEYTISSDNHVEDGNIQNLLFKKIMSYSYESEYRFIAYKDKKLKEFYLQIDDLGDFFDEILIAPAIKQDAWKAKNLHSICWPIWHKSQIAKGESPTLNNKHGKPFCRISQLYGNIAESLKNNL